VSAWLVEPVVSTSVRYNKRLLLSGRERLSRRRISLILGICGGFGTPRSRSAGRYAESLGSSP
jgi:hypothetical protein